MSLGTTEEWFLQGLKRSKSSENLGSSRETGEFRLDRPSSSGKEGERAKTSEEHWQELEKIETSLFKVSKELYLVAGIITKYEKQPPQILGETLEMYKKVNECLKNLEKVVETYKISDGDFQRFFESSKKLIEENKKQFLISVGKDDKKIKNELDTFEKRARLWCEVFDKAKESCGLETLETFRKKS